MPEKKFRVLIIYPKEHGPNAWLSVKGKSRWRDRRHADYHAERVRTGRHPVLNWADVKVVKTDAA